MKTQDPPPCPVLASHWVVLPSMEGGAVLTDRGMMYCYLGRRYDVLLLGVKGWVVVKG